MSATTQQTAEQVRGIPLQELLRWHGFKIRQEGVSIRARSDRHNIVVTGSKWFDNKTGTGGAGAIDLQMHLCGGDFQTTCHVLAEGFRPTGAGLVFPPDKNPDSRRRPFEELAAQYAVPSLANWPIARDYLVETRKIEPAIVHELHGRGSIYANNHQPNPGIVFLHRTPHGKVEGATLRDTRHESSFRPCLGNKLSAWFSIGDLAKAETVVAVESPIEALSYHTLFAGRNDPLAIVSCSGSFVPEELMFQAYDRRQSFVVALNNDDAGEFGWQKAWDGTTDWTGFKISSACPRLKDWNADLMSSQRITNGPRNSLHL
ncbi:MAG: DUF3991 domain-containing protein [Verrucomicrobia bacterium]|nr:DUF3991 domain-containing protein [Verrucomicrobiota bacterium]